MKAWTLALVLCTASATMRAEEPDWFDAFRGRAVRAPGGTLEYFVDDFGSRTVRASPADIAAGTFDEDERRDLAELLKVSLDSNRALGTEFPNYHLRDPLLAVNVAFLDQLQPPTRGRSFSLRPRRSHGPFPVARPCAPPSGSPAVPGAARTRRNQVSGRRRPGRRCSRPSSFLRKIFFFSSFLTAAGHTSAEEAPKVTLERLVDGRGNRVCDIAKASVKHDNESRSAWVVRGLLRSDLVLRREARKDVNSDESTVNEIRLDDHAPLRLEGGASGSRVSASSPASTFRYFDADAGRKTVRCNLSRLVSETDPDPLNAVAEYGIMKQGLGETYGSEELPILTLLTVEKRPPHPSPPIRRKEPLHDDAPEAVELKAAALAALGDK